MAHFPEPRSPVLSPCKSVDSDGGPSTMSTVSLNSSTSRTSLISLNRVCRICQSETGIMVRPCACAGTMGDIHEICLNQWVSHSRAQKCEICKEPYAKSSRKLRPVREWTKPKVSFRECLAFGSVCCLVYSCFNLVYVAIKRHFFERVFVLHYNARGSDLGRIVVLLIVFVLLVTMTSILSSGITGYFAKQMVVRFVNNHAHDHHDKKAKTKTKPCPKEGDLSS